jgi:hypothetical protein
MFGLIIGHSMKLINGFLPNAADHPLSGFNTLSFLLNYLDFREVIIEDLYLILWMVNIVMFVKLNIFIKLKKLFLKIYVPHSMDATLLITRIEKYAVYTL